MDDRAWLDHGGGPMSDLYRVRAESGGAGVAAWGDALIYAVAAGAPKTEVLGAWDAGRAVPVPTGVLWDVVRVVRPAGIQAVDRLRTAGDIVGPVLDVPLRASVEFIVTAGTTRHWPRLPGTLCVGWGESRLPAPDMTLKNGRRAQCGRRWLTPWTPIAVPVTDSDALCECLTAALAHRALAHLRTAAPR
jgi:hypothetical protein